MTSLESSFQELQERLKSRPGFSNMGDDPVYYLIFSPSKMLEVKSRHKEWEAKLKLDGWEVEQLSLADTIHDIFQNHDLRPCWLKAEKEAPFDFAPINDTLRDVLTADDTLRNRILQKLEELKDRPSALLILTDLEALHPYLRIGSIEQRLQGRFHVPTVILYPGRRVGRTTLSFLGIYAEDGNYRSIHIGD